MDKDSAKWTIEERQEAVYCAIRDLGMLEYGTFMLKHVDQPRSESEGDWLKFHGLYDLSDEQAMKTLPLHIYQAYAVAHGGKSWDAIRRYKAFHAKEGTNQ